MAASTRPFDRAAAVVAPLDADAAADAAAHHRRLTKPRGALGRLEDAGCRLAAIAGAGSPPVPEPAVVAVFAADHGVVAQGVSAWPQEVTAQMVANLCAGGAAINVLARQAGASVVVVDVGVAHPIASAPALVRRPVRPRGTADISLGPAMSVAEAREALDVGAEVAATAVADGARCLITGDMGIGNTTASAALVAALTDQAMRSGHAGQAMRSGHAGQVAAEVTGRGAGADDATLAHKVVIVQRALDRAAADGSLAGGPLAVLASLGGLEIAALAGFVVGGAAARVPVLIDGVIALAGALAAEALAPGVVGYCVAGHRSTEPGASVALAALGLEPLLDLGLRLGEGTGACLALPLLQASARVLREMATFDGAGVTDKE